MKYQVLHKSKTAMLFKTSIYSLSFLTLFLLHTLSIKANNISVSAGAFGTQDKSAKNNHG
jgi:hypothetical protein